MKPLLSLIFSLLFVKSSLVFSQTKDELIKDIDAYCKYISEKNAAKNILLNSPDAIARFDNGDVYNKLQKVVMVGLSKDLSDFSKAKFVRQLIHEECHYYQLNQEAKLQIEYGLAAVKVASLKFKMQQIDRAKKKLNHLLTQIEERMHSQNETIKSYYRVDSYLKKLEDMERQIRVDLASLPIPKTRPVKLKHLRNELVSAQHRRQHTLNTLEKQDNWSFQLQAGAQQNLSTHQHFPTHQNQTVQPYFSLSFRYNLGSIPSSQQVNQSEESFITWQKNQVLGTQRKLSNLLISLISLKAAEEERLNYLRRSYHSYDELNKTMNSVHTSEATHFKQELEVDRILADIEIKYVQRTIQLLQNSIG